MSTEIDVKSNAYKDRFIARLVGVGCDRAAAMCEFEAQDEGVDVGDLGDPEEDADECMSYWGD